MSAILFPLPIGFIQMKLTDKNEYLNFERNLTIYSPVNIFETLNYTNRSSFIVSLHTVDLFQYISIRATCRLFLSLPKKLN